MMNRDNTAMESIWSRRPYKGVAVMKRFVIVVLVLAISVTGLFAKAEAGVGINLLFTGVDAAFESAHFGVEAMFGLPLIHGAVNAISYYAKGGVDDSGNALPEPKLADFCLPYLMASGYWKVIDGKVFGLNLGLQADSLVLINKNNEPGLIGMWGVSLGLDFKLSETCALNVTGTFPGASLLSMINEDAASYGVFSYNLDSGTGDVIFTPLLIVLSQMARVSCRWAL